MMMVEPFRIEWRDWPTEYVETWRRLRAKLYFADLEKEPVNAIYDGDGRRFSVAEVLAVPINDLGYPVW